MILGRFLLLALMAFSGANLFAGTASAQIPFLTPDSTGKETLEIGTSTNEIAITSDFRGADLTVFGALNNVDQLLLAIGQYDVVVTLEGPREAATVRRKERFLGIWVNRQSLTFERVPTSYSVASTRPVQAIAPREVLNDLGLGVDYLPLTPTGHFVGDINMGEFRAAYRRLQQTSGLYQEGDTGIRFVSTNLFRASLRLPASIPDGVHVVHAYLFKSGVFLAQKDLRLRVVKTGVEQAITDAAHNQPLSYGIFAVLVAVITGWTASIVFRKD
ncbi:MULTISPECIES: TIGR02186 family protein [Rhizobium/Agrobacterium group]|uniref:TIGR02186 family protein n=1 Tax=Rhizobium/Agrobacterium group TaxID=227290 RepID=UPI001F16C74B|nr:MULTISPECIES: TIGR02186 family protein [Rhizobium/Agrobacterium group]